MRAQDEIHERLVGEFCSMLDVTPLPDGAFAFSTPFLFGDGDGLPVVLEPVLDGWRFTDRGGAASHLFFDEDEMTPGRWEFVKRSAALDGLNVSDTYVLTSDVFDTIPTAVDLADFVQAVARIGAVSASERHPQERYIIAVRTEVQRWLPDNYGKSGWHDPVQDPDGLYRADLWVPVSGHPALVMFFVASDDRATRSALNVRAYREDFGLDERPFILHRPDLPPNSTRRLVQAVHDATQVLAVEPGEYAELRHQLSGLGAPV